MTSLCKETLEFDPDTEFTHSVFVSTFQLKEPCVEGHTDYVSIRFTNDSDPQLHCNLSMDIPLSQAQQFFEECAAFAARKKAEATEAAE